MTDQQRARAEAHATIVAGLGLTRADAALFTAVYYGHNTTPEFLTGRAAAEDYNPIGPVVTEEECRVALSDCLARGWLQIVDKPTRERIIEELRAGQYIGPIYQGGDPEVGCVDFADAGLVLWRRLKELTGADQCPPFAYTDVVREKTARFFRTAAAAAIAIEERRKQQEVVAVTGPTPIGPWRAQWWRRFSEGYRVDIEERRWWQGRGSGGGEECYFERSTRNADPRRLQSVLDSRIVLEHVAKGNVVRKRRVVPIGPWCVRWCERFPAGYRLELELGEP